MRNATGQCPATGIRWPLGGWCRLRSYLDSAAALGITTLDGISSAVAGKPWLPATAPIS